MEFVCSFPYKGKIAKRFKENENRAPFRLNLPKGFGAGGLRNFVSGIVLRDR